MGVRKSSRHSWLPVGRNMAHSATQRRQCDWPERWAGARLLRALKIMGKTLLNYLRSVEKPHRH